MCVVMILIFTMYAAGYSAPDQILCCILDQLKVLSQQNASIVNRMAAIEALVHKPHVQFDIGDAPRQEGSGDPVDVAVVVKWVCPFCEEPLLHRESFKGHIRALVYRTSRPKCHLHPKKHAMMVSRFAGDSFYEKEKNFHVAFYSEVRSCCTSLDSVQQSIEHIRNWLAVCMSGSDDPLPVYDVSCRAVRAYKRSESPGSARSSSSRSRSDE